MENFQQHAPNVQELESLAPLCLAMDSSSPYWYESLISSLSHLYFLRKCLNSSVHYCSSSNTAVMNTTAKAVFITAKFAFIFTSFSAVQRYDFPIFTFVYLPLHGFILIQHNDQSPAGMLAQLVEHCTGIAEGHGFKSPIGLNFFRPYLHYCSRSVHYC